MSDLYGTVIQQDWSINRRLQLTKVKTLFVTGIVVAVAVGLLQTFGPVFTTQTPTRDDDARIVELRVEIGKIGDRPSAAWVSAHSISNLKGRQEWTEQSWTDLYYEVITVPRFESVQFFLTATPMGPIDKRRSVTCSIKVSGREVPGSPDRQTSYPHDPGRECAATVTVLALK